VTIDLKGTGIGELSAPEKRKGRLKHWKVDISKPRIPEGIVTIDLRRPRVIRSWTLSEILGASGV
jgi:hypothetical protein